MTITPNQITFLRLTPTSDVSSFRCCEDLDLEEFLKEDSKKYDRERITTTYLGYIDGQLVSFFSLAMGCVSSETVQDMMGEIRYPPKKFPALLIARMATKDGFQGQGIGKIMLAHVISISLKLCPLVGCRFIKVDAKNNEKTPHFYSTYGNFQRISENVETVQMIVDINRLSVPDSTTESHLGDFTAHKSSLHQG